MDVLSGVFYDCWTSRTAIFEINNSNAGNDIFLTLYLPDVTGSSGKTITISDGIHSSQWFVQRGDQTEVGPINVRKVPLRITLTCPTPEPVSTHEKRQLGCVLISAKMGDSTIRFSTLLQE